MLSCRPPLPLNPYRLFHLSARLRLHTPTPTQAASNNDDYYTLLLDQPTSNPSQKPISPKSPRTHPLQSSSTTSIQTSSQGPNNQVLFSAPLSGPSPRMRGLARAEQGLNRPAEPDNCCMSGCVNCVWDAYREEVEVWAEERRKRIHDEIYSTKGTGSRDEDEDGNGGQLGELDEPGIGFGDMDLGNEAMFEGVPVGIREFMNTEKRLRERRTAERGKT